jgi:LuxR family maltose regulon positive regulatory protein
MTSLATTDGPLTTTTIMRAPGAKAPSACEYALVEVRPDGSFGRARLLQDGSQVGEAAMRGALADGNWRAVATCLVDTHAVVRVLAGTENALDLWAGVADVSATQPVLRAALAVARGDSAAAGAALARIDGSDETRGAAERLGISCTQMALARLTGDVATGTAHEAEARLLMHQLPVQVLDQLPELSVLLDAHLGALQVLAGRLHEAAHTLARGASTRTVPDTCGAREDCEGQLSLLEAFRGNLRRATLHAERVLEVADEVGGTGTTHAHLARAWVHLERDELAEARDRLDLAGVVPGGGREPWLVISSLLAHARLLTAAGEPEASLRLLAEATSTAWSTGNAEWFRDLLAVDSAEFLIAAGEPQRALALVTPLPPRAASESSVLAAVARRDIGDMRGARAVLGTVVPALLGAPAGVQIRSWLLEARLAQDHGDVDRARLLVDRALRVGAAEELRRPFAHDWAWLRSYLDRDLALLREHGTFVASFPASRSPQPPVRTAAAGDGEGVVGTLTERESEVLGLLAQMYSTEEIALALFVSPNTVKTHLKGIFGKLCVSRRVDAVRRGRQLGLC